MGTIDPDPDFDTSAMFRCSLTAEEPGIARSGASLLAMAGEDAELLRACSDFQNAHAELDQLLNSESNPPEPQVFLLNQRWHEACLKAASLAATTTEGRHAKAAMLLAVMDVVLGTDAGDRALHEVLAASLARDC